MYDFAIITRKHLGKNLFFNTNADLQSCNFIKKRLQHKCLLTNIEKFLRTPILNNICERLVLRVFLHEKITQEMKKTFSQKRNQKKQKKLVLKLSYMKKNCLFMMFFIILFFSISPLLVRRRLLQMIKDDDDDDLFLWYG